MNRTLVTIAFAIVMAAVWFVGLRQGGSDAMAYARSEAWAYRQELEKRDDLLAESWYREQKAEAEARYWMRTATGPWAEGTMVWDCVVVD